MNELLKKFSSIIRSKQVVRWVPVVVILIVIIVSFVTCSKRGKIDEELESPPTETVIKESPSETPTASTPSINETPDTSETPVETTPEEVDPGPRNPLTGLPCEEDVLIKRPIAIMINNISVAQPQLGVSKADIIYEMLVEGGITRMMALFSDMTGVGVIGSIRSARPYYIDVAVSYDAVYIHAGGSPQAYTMLRAPNITSLDGVGGRDDIFYRDQWRRTNLGSEHSLVSTGELIAKWLPTYDFRLEHEEDYDNSMLFTEDGKPDKGSPATEFSVMFSSSKSTSFTYDTEDKQYYLRQYNKPYNDGNDNTQLAVTNVLILKTAVANIQGDREGRITVATVGTGSGYFICGGAYVEIEWSREVGGRFTYKLKDGSDLVLGTGKTYICVIPNANDVSIA